MTLVDVTTSLTYAPQYVSETQTNVFPIYQTVYHAEAVRQAHIASGEDRDHSIHGYSLFGWLHARILWLPQMNIMDEITPRLTSLHNNTKRSTSSTHRIW